jgi:hypothetical protein
LFHTVYNSFEKKPQGRDYIGKHSTLDPYDCYLGSFKDKSFCPDDKIILGYSKTPEGAVWLEIQYQKAFGVVENPQFANLSYQTSDKFVTGFKGEENPNFGNRYTLTLDQKKKLYDRSGENNPMYGKRGEDNPNFGKKRTEEQKVKFQGENNGFYGKNHSDETKECLSEAKRGEKNPWFGVFGEDHPSFGRKDSDEVRKKKSESAKKAWEERRLKGKTSQTHSTNQ